MKHICINEIGVSETGKTKIWRVLTKETDGCLGLVKWFGRWRRYAFFTSINIIYEQDCLRDIANFIEAETKKHRTGARDDPTANLEEIRELVAALQDDANGKTWMDRSSSDDVERLCELFAALDAWMSKGGSPPDSWQP